MLNDKKILKITLATTLVIVSVFSGINAYRYQRLNNQVASFSSQLMTTTSEDEARFLVLDLMDVTHTGTKVITAYANEEDPEGKSRADCDKDTDKDCGDDGKKKPEKCKGWSVFTCIGKSALNLMGFGFVNNLVFPEGRDLITFGSSSNSNPNTGRPASSGSGNGGGSHATPSGSGNGGGSHATPSGSGNGGGSHATPSGPSSGSGTSHLSPTSSGNLQPIGNSNSNQSNGNNNSTAGNNCPPFMYCNGTSNYPYYSNSSSSNSNSSSSSNNNNSQPTIAKACGGAIYYLPDEQFSYDYCMFMNSPNNINSSTSGSMTTSGSTSPGTTNNNQSSGNQPWAASGGGMGAICINGKCVLNNR